MESNFVSIEAFQSSYHAKRKKQPIPYNDRQPIKLNRDQVKFRGGSQQPVYPAFDFDSGKAWTGLLKDVLADHSSRLLSSGFFAEAYRLGKLFVYGSAGIGEIISGMIKEEFSDSPSAGLGAQSNDQEQKLNPIVEVYKGLFSKEHQDFVAFRLFVIEAVESLSETLERSNRPSVQSFRQSFVSKMRKEIFDAHDELGGVSREYMQRCVDRLADLPKALPTIILTGAMFSSNDEVREKATKRFDELCNKKDQRGYPYIDPLLPLLAYALLLDSDLSETQSSSVAEEGSVAKLMADDPKFKDIANKAKGRILNNIVSYAKIAPVYLETIELLLDNVDQQKKGIILKELQEYNLSNRLGSQAEVRKVSDRMYGKGYDLKNGKLRNVAFVSSSQEVSDTNTGLQASQASHNISQSDISPEFKKLVDDAFVQGTPHGRLFVVADDTKLDSLGHYATARMAKLCQDSQSKFISKTIKTKEDIKSLFDELSNATQEHENPKVIALLDKSTTPKVRCDFWKKYKACVDPATSTFLALYTPVPSQKEYAPYDTLATRVSTFEV